MPFSQQTFCLVTAGHTFEANAINDNSPLLNICRTNDGEWKQESAVGREGLVTGIKGDVVIAR